MGVGGGRDGKREVRGVCCFPKLAEEPVLENGGRRVKPSWREKGGGGQIKEVG